jgi:hypothetical protein
LLVGSNVYNYKVSAIAMLSYILSFSSLWFLATFSFLQLFFPRYAMQAHRLDLVELTDHERVFGVQELEGYVHGIKNHNEQQQEIQNE